MKRPFTVALILVACAIITPLAQAPRPATGSGSLTVAGDVAQTLTLQAAQLRDMPRTTVTITDDSGRKSTYEGVLVGELLRRAGASLGEGMRSPLLTSYVLATAADGYRVAFSLGELDSGLTSNEIIVADTMDGKPLGSGQGPFRLVAPHDKRAIRAVRMLERLEVVQLRK